MIVAVETCNCVGPMIDSGWVVFLGAVAVLGPAFVASVLRRRRRKLTAVGPLPASSGQSTAEDAWTGAQPEPVTAGRKDHAASPAVDATGSTEAHDVG